MAEKKDFSKFNRTALEELFKRRFFFVQSFEIYGGVKGLYDYGPPGSAIKSNLLNLWRQFFILEENMLEIDCPSLTPAPVLKASGHVDKFEDLMVRDTKTSECHRADHLLNDHLDVLLADKNLTEKTRTELLHIKAQVDSYSASELGEYLKRFKVKAPTTKNEISDPFPFNLMFGTEIGPTGKEKGYLRPETAQGIFVNFRRLLDYNGGKLPFAAAQIGAAFRNEISPRAGLLRVREFTLAEIEHFVDPGDKRHPKFASVASYVLPLYPRDSQLSDNQLVLKSIGEAVEQRIVNNQTLGYFLVRVHQFLVKVGVHADKIRFRQHLANEMAHYASDCWDAEILSSYGWVECVGNADRSCFDLNNHALKSGIDLNAFVLYPEGPREQDVYEINFDRKLIGQTLRGESKKVIPVLEYWMKSQSLLQSAYESIQKNGFVEIEGLKITNEMLKLEKTRKQVNGYNLVPSVIEPSFGIGRIIYCLLEHAYWVRDGDEQRAVLSLSPIIAPIKCSILPLISNDQLYPKVIQLAKLLTDQGISNKVDDRGGASIGRRYARTDEIGVPFGVTVDFDTLKDDTVTVRERDSTLQVRISISLVAQVIDDLSKDKIKWSDVVSKYPKFESTSD